LETEKLRTDIEKMVPEARGARSQQQLLRGKYYYYYYFVVNCEPSFGKMNLFHIMSDP